MPGLRLSSLLLLAAVILALFVSGAALNDLGLNYSGDDGAGGIKIHPYVIFTLLTILVRLSGRTRLADRRWRNPLVCSIIAVAVLIIRAVSTSSQSLGFAVDTILAAFWVAATIPFMDDRMARRIWNLGLVFVISECSMAIFEVATKTQFIPIDTWYGSYFRATALHGHPLNNALILITVASALQMSGSRRVSILLFVLTTAALSAFGARGALFVYVVLNSLSLARYGLRSVGRMAVVSLGVPVAALLVGWTVMSGAFGDRIANVGAYDGSSNVRLQSIAILQRVDWEHILVGTDPDRVSKLMSQANVGVIENFFVAYTLMFGLVCTLLLFACIWGCFRTMVREHHVATRRRIYLILVAFFLTAFTNNSLVTKTPALYLCFVFCWAAGREMERRRLAASTRKVRLIEAELSTRTGASDRLARGRSFSTYVTES